MKKSSLKFLLVIYVHLFSDVLYSFVTHVKLPSLRNRGSGVITANNRLHFKLAKNKSIGREIINNECVTGNNHNGRMRLHNDSNMEYRKFYPGKPIVSEKSLNKITLIGRVGCEPDIKILSGGDKVATFSLATNEYWKDKNTNELRSKTDWHRIVVYDQGIVELIHKYLKKGRRVYIQGSLQYRKWFSNDLNTSQRQITEIVLSYNKSDLIFLDDRRQFMNRGDTGTAVGSGSNFNGIGNNQLNRRSGRNLTNLGGMNRNDMTIMNEHSERNIRSPMHNSNSINEIENEEENDEEKNYEEEDVSKKETEGYDDNEHIINNEMAMRTDEFSSKFTEDDDIGSLNLPNTHMEDPEGIYDKMSPNDFEE